MRIYCIYVHSNVKYVQVRQGIVDWGGEKKKTRKKSPNMPEKVLL